MKSFQTHVEIRATRNGRYRLRVTEWPQYPFLASFNAANRAVRGSINRLFLHIPNAQFLRSFPAPCLNIHVTPHEVTVF